MIKRILFTVACASLAMALSSCISTRYTGPTDHVGYRTDGKFKSSAQSSGLNAETDPLVSTYYQENTYDDKGNVVKVKLTEYIDLLDNDKKFIVWETEYKNIGGTMVPFKISANGVAFVEVEYELLTVATKGAILEDIPNRPFNIEYKSGPLAAPMYFNLNIALGNHEVNFDDDNQFVKEVRRYNEYGSYTEHILTLGWDNIALKRYFYSREKLSEGIAKSYTGYNYNSEMLRKMSKGNNVEYRYEWKVIANTICQTKMTYEVKSFKMEVSEDYNAAGKRTKEVWMVSDPSKKESKPVQIFQQELAY